MQQQFMNINARRPLPYHYITYTPLNDQNLIMVLRSDRWPNGVIVWDELSRLSLFSQHGDTSSASGRKPCISMFQLCF